MNRHIPNLLSLLRVFLSLSLIPIMSDRIAFPVIYIVTGCTDILDGFIARRFGFTSDWGARLDSAADFVFYCVLMIIVFRQYYPLLNGMHKIVLLAILCIRFLNIGLTGIKYKQVVFVHTLSNKAAGLIVFFTPIVFLTIQADWIIWLILMPVLAAAVEECLITLKYPKPDLNRRSIFG